MIFGRAGEEIAELNAAGIPGATVPGVTAALAISSRPGVSLTDRVYAHSVRFVTGHSRDRTFPRHLDWHGLADPKTTLIVYMGGSTAAQMASRLIHEGLSPATPVVLAENLSRSDERIQHADLGSLSHAVLSLNGPIIIGIGMAFRQTTAATDLAAVPASDSAETARRCFYDEPMIRRSA
jgi:uroporphyrin-III C-methyltransferase/precorrin-2 dehydrogenase/sirohydrochlorin ferrochelatase